MTSQHNIQVPWKKYFEDYDDMPRFASYFFQISQVKKLNPKNILEIGVGNKTVFNYLKQAGFSISSCDFDEKLKPD